MASSTMLKSPSSISGRRDRLSSFDCILDQNTGCACGEFGA